MYLNGQKIMPLSRICRIFNHYPMKTKNQGILVHLDLAIQGGSQVEETTPLDKGDILSKMKLTPTRLITGVKIVKSLQIDKNSGQTWAVDRFAFYHKPTVDPLGCQRYGCCCNQFISTAWVFHEISLMSWFLCLVELKSQFIHSRDVPPEGLSTCRVLPTLSMVG